MKRTRGSLLLAAVLFVVGAAAIWLGGPFTERPVAGAAAAEPRAPSSSTWRLRVDTLRRGEALSTVLARAGVPQSEAARALSAASSVDMRNLRAGTEVHTRASADSGVSEIVLHLSIDRLLHLRRSRSAEWVESDERIPWAIDTVAVSARVTSTLTDAVERGAISFPASERDNVAYALGDILEYRVDLSRDLQKGDTVRVLVERKSAPNGIVRAGQILAARITVDGRRVETVRYTNAESRAQYFDGEGKTMRAAFLRAPLAFRRISSVFGMRKHPILGIRRQHQGTDYSAARGTDVRAVGDGTVTFAGWKGGYGRVIDIRHRNGIVSRYGHLQGFAKGIRVGTVVGISRTIGFVGMTGLATAPHLHFEVLVAGVNKDPRTALQSVTGDPLAEADRSAFATLRAAVFSRLDSMADDREPVATDMRGADGVGASRDAARQAGEE